MARRERLSETVTCFLVAALASFGCGGDVQRAGSGEASGEEASSEGSAAGAGSGAARSSHGGAQQLSGTGGTPDESFPAHCGVDAESPCGWEFIDVGGQATGCDFELETQLEDPRLVNVAIDCELLPTVAEDGTLNWSLDSENVLHFAGETCRRLRNGEVEFIDVVMGCPLPL